MPIRYWLLVVTLGCLIGSPLAAQEPSLSVDGQQIAQEEVTESEPAGEQDTSAELPQPPDLTPAIQSVEAAIRALVSQQNPPESDEERDRAERDLDAQENMAWWAAAMFFATLASVLVTAAGVYLVWKTLNATQRAAHYAKLAADHAESAAKAGWEAVRQAEVASNVTQDIFAKDSRPWLDIEIRRVEKMEITTTHGIVFWLKVSMQNCGKTPAAGIVVKPKIFASNSVSSIANFDRGEKWLNTKYDHIYNTSGQNAGFLLFPGQKRTIRVNAMIPTTEWMAASKAMGGSDPVQVNGTIRLYYRAGEKITFTDKFITLSRTDTDDGMGEFRPPFEDVDGSLLKASLHWGQAT